MTRSFRPTTRLAAIEARAKLLREIRTLLDERGLLEVQTPLLSRETVVDRHLAPVEVSWGGQTRYLQTSPELSMKRLLTALVEERPDIAGIWQITHSVRGGEIGSQHNPEFTIVEWYGLGNTYADGIHTIGLLASRLLARPEVLPVTYRDAFLRRVMIDPHEASAAQLRHTALREGIAIPDSLGTDSQDRDALLDLILSEVIQPELGHDRPTVLCDYPASQAALARVFPDPTGVPIARRFELIVDGVELANGYHELADADELRHRIDEANAWRTADGNSRLPPCELLLSAMEADFPSCCGVALGLDRLLMIRLGAERLDEVMPFPWEIA